MKQSQSVTVELLPAMEKASFLRQLNPCVAQPELKILD